jgi:hypothetical protein
VSPATVDVELPAFDVKANRSMPVALCSCSARILSSLRDVVLGAVAVAILCVPNLSCALAFRSVAPNIGWSTASI